MNKIIKCQSDNRLIISKISENTYQINECGVFCYLIVGSESALLIDTGTGLCNMADAVREITQKPLIVVATHAHPDHIGGRGAFKTIYISPFERYKRIYGSMYVRKKLFSKENAEKYGFTLADIKKPKYKTKFLTLSDGQKFDLGNNVITAISAPGHTKGGTIFLSESNKIIITGDNVCQALWMFLPGSTSIEEWIYGAELTLKLCSNFTPYCAHSREPQDVELISNLINAAKELVSQTDRNRFSRKKRIYPTNYTNFGIIYKSSKILKK